MLEKPGPGRNLYTQIFRARAGSCSGAYTESSKSRAQGRISILKFSGLWQVPGPGRIQQARKAGPWAEPAYSNFPSQGRLLFWGVYRKLEKPGPGRNLYTQIFRVQAGSCSRAYTASSKSQGPGRNLYTQIFRARIGSWSRAYTEARKAEPRAESVYSNFQGSGRFLVQGVYKILEKTGPRQNLYTQIFRALAGT